jgi:peptidoglycan hydrolase-like protein with peptidoglycan-binding domain
MIDHDELVRTVADRLGRRADTLPIGPGSIGAAKRRARQRHQHRLAGVSVLGITAAAIGTIGVVRRDDGVSSIVPATTDAITPSTGTPSTGTLSAATPSTAITPSSTSVLHPGDTDLHRGDTGATVRDVQVALNAHGFDPGPVDGVFGASTEQAVWAAEGVLLGRPWEQQTGVVDAALLDALASGSPIAPRRAIEGDHTEIYLDLQALVVFHGFDPVLVTHISSGDGQQWCAVITTDTDDTGGALPEPVQQDVCGVSKTPGGVFQFYRKVAGDRFGPLGGMYNPVYFNYGIAVYGAHSVPKVPASHGAIRIPMAIAEYFPSLVSNKDFVFVWDGTTEPEQVTKKDSLPTFNYPNPASTSPTATASAG